MAASKLKLFSSRSAPISAHQNLNTALPRTSHNSVAGIDKKIQHEYCLYFLNHIYLKGGMLWHK
jgi:hypothetical protein